MIASVRSSLLRFLRVPPEPAVPDGAGAAQGSSAVTVFRAAPGYFRYKLVLWCLKQGGALVGLIFGLAFATRFAWMLGDGGIALLIYAAEALAWTLFVVQVPFSYAVLRLDFEMRWYILSDRSLRIREGILHLREKTMTFANIQEITIRRNPLQGLLGIADVRVRTAGGGGGGKGRPGEKGESMHVAFFRGVENAEKIRDVIRERVRRYQDSDSGETGGSGIPSGSKRVPSESAGAERLPGAAAISAAAELRDEMRALGAAIRNRPPDPAPARRSPTRP